VTRTHTMLLVGALMLGTFLAALDSTVVGTAMPTIVGKLGGVSLFSWVIAAYLLTSTTTVPVYGKLSDLYGRKPVLLVGIGLFLFGSVLCGLSQSMVQLIVFRAVQGLGAGAVLPITITIVGDLFTIEQRARLQGAFSSVWGVSSIAGPALGALITESVGWRWVFYINLPVGLLCALLIATMLNENVVRRRHEIDYIGAATLTGGLTALLLGLLQGGEAWAWLSGQSLSIFALALLLLAWFVRQETRAAEPILPLSLFRNRIIAVASIAGMLSGGVMFGVTSFVPLFAQGVRGGTARDAGLVLIPMSLGWTVGSVITGRVIVRRGYRPAILVGGCCLLVGGVLLLAVTRDSHLALLLTLLTLIGLGMGFSNSAFIISLQNAVSWSQRGVATATNQFSRTIGGSVGVAVMGAVLNSRWRSTAAGLGGGTVRRANTLLDPDQRAALPADTLASMQDALATALHGVYIVVGLFAVLVFLAALFFPRGRAQELAAGKESPHPETEVEPATLDSGVPAGG
jgi:EmrB/QacA subfamily drug resistance transporter